MNPGSFRPVLLVVLIAGGLGAISAHAHGLCTGGGQGTQRYQESVNDIAGKPASAAQYSLTSNVALRGEWEHNRPDAFGIKPDIDHYVFGVHVVF